MGKGSKLSAIQIQIAIVQSSGNLLSLSTTNNFTKYYSEGIINNDEVDSVFEGMKHGMNCAQYMMKDCST